MPMNKAHYPPEWNQISNRIRFGRAGGKCEQCGAPHGKYIIRDSKYPSLFTILPDNTSSILRELFLGMPIEEIKRAVNVVLTVHHKGVPKPDGTAGDPTDKMDCRDENLIALCQRCHLLADREIRAAKRCK